MDAWTGTNGGGTVVYRSLCEDSRFWVVKRVMNDVDEKDTAKILVCLSERALGTVCGGRCAGTE